MTQSRVNIATRALSWQLGASSPLDDLIAFAKLERDRMQRSLRTQSITDYQAEALIRIAMRLGAKIDGKEPGDVMRELNQARAEHRRAKLAPMHPKTEAIAYFENDEDARRAGYTIPLRPGEAERLIPVNRTQRRKALRDDRRAQRRARRAR